MFLKDEALFLQHASHFLTPTWAPATPIHPLPLTPLLYLPSCTNAPFRLTPVRRPTEIHPRPAVIAPTTAQPLRTPHIDNRPTRFPLRCNSRRSRRIRWRSFTIALAETGLAAVATVEVLVLEVVFGTAVAVGAAAAVVVGAGAGAGAGDVGGGAAGVDVGERGCGGGGFYGSGWEGGGGGGHLELVVRVRRREG